jgi:hypothetical protein
MMRKLLAVLLCVGLFAGVGLVSAQEDTTSTAPSSTIDYYVVLCEDRAVVEFSGVMQSGYSIYYRIFSATGGGGNALTDLRRVSVSGAYTVSEGVTYSGGTLPANSVGSAYVAIARTNDSSSVIFSDYVEDLQDGCREATGTTTSTGIESDSTSTGTNTGNVSRGQFSDGTSAILSPFGGYINTGYIPPERPLVQVGARDQFILSRQSTPGLIFAECESFPVAEPGLVYDTDQVIIFWSWFTATEAQMLDHIENAQYSVTYYQTLPLPEPIVRTPIRRINGNYWVFYYSVLGNLRPGEYAIEYKLNWAEPHYDGITNYGPDTDNPLELSGCVFDVLPNPDGRVVSHNPWPYQYIND